LHATKTYSNQLIALTAKYRLPTVYAVESFATSGGLAMSVPTATQVTRAAPGAEAGVLDIGADVHTNRREVGKQAAALMRPAGRRSGASPGTIVP